MAEERKLLNIDLGIKTYVLKASENGEDDVTVSFNPTDAVFGKKLSRTFEQLSEKEEEYRKKMDELDGKNTFELAAELDTEMREYINELFEKDICTALVGNMNIYAMAGGMPIWANLLFAILDEMDDTFTKEQKLSNEKIKKYTDKYKNRSSGSKYHK